MLILQKTMLKAYAVNEQTYKMAKAIYLGFYENETGWDNLSEKGRHTYICIALQAQIAGGYIEPVDVIKFEIQDVEKISTDPITCEHANEVPHVCKCPPTCYCKANTCRTYQYMSALCCEHANENPKSLPCPCPENCYCKQYNCKH